MRRRSLFSVLLLVTLFSIGYFSPSAAASSKKRVVREKPISRVLITYKDAHAKNYTELRTFISGFASRVPSLAADSAKSASPMVRLIYLIPADKQVSVAYREAIEKAGMHLRIWYRMQMENIFTFELYNPIVEIYNTTHSSSWYAAHPTQAEQKYWFWENVLHDAFALTGGKFNDSQNRWIYYIDADPTCGQIGGGGTSGVAVLPANDLRGLTGEERVRICPNDAPDTTGICRWIGGLGHELGHAFDLPHPPECENGSASCPTNALMWLGYLSYPNAHLTISDKNKLRYHSFFSGTFSSEALPLCGM